MAVDETTGVYNVQMSCGNCGWRGPVAVQRGVLVQAGEAGPECTNCGCRTLEKQWAGRQAPAKWLTPGRVIRLMSDPEKVLGELGQAVRDDPRLAGVTKWAEQIIKGER